MVLEPRKQAHLVRVAHVLEAVDSGNEGTEVLLGAHYFVAPAEFILLTASSPFQLTLKKPRFVPLTSQFFFLRLRSVWLGEIWAHEVQGGDEFLPALRRPLRPAL